MAYNITLSNGTALITGGLPDGTIDTANTSLTLVGKNYPGYGAFLNENFVRLMENFAKGTRPAAPLPGQLWWDSTNRYLNVNTATTKGTANERWRTLVTTTVGSAPTSPVTGEQWFDTAARQLKVYSGDPVVGWVTVGPAATTSTGNSGAIPDLVTDSSGGTHVCINFYISNARVGIWSVDQFNTTIAGFDIVYPGLNLNSTLGLQFFGNASAALALNVSGTNYSSDKFLRRDTNETMTGSFTIANDTGLTLGAGSDLRVLVGGVYTDDVEIRNTTTAGNLVLSIKNQSGVQTRFLRGNAISGLPEAYNSPSASSDGLSLVTKNYVDSVTGVGGTGTSTFTANINPTANVFYTLGNTTNRWSNIFLQSALVGNVYAANTFATQSNVTTIFIAGDVIPTANLTSNIGSTTRWFDTFHGKSVQAQYADLAERFATDVEYLPGTVVQLGGVNEITAAYEELTEDVFGVISTRAAFLMNGAAGENSTHPPVAVSGRVPVRVIGKIRKGDRLVSAGNGLARAASRNEITAFNVIGRSLENKDTLEEGLVEATVKLNS